MKCTRLNALFTSKVGFKPMNFSEIIPFCPRVKFCQEIVCKTATHYKAI